ncbi:MAG: sulfotransferase domain-containing protein [Rhodospirillaceae bacterium]|nr:sulfotransferase domain-containing protein [Rhodospirillaceae bacterium]
MAILWLASYPKSGNTWVRAFLANLFANPDQPVHVNQLRNFAFGDHQGAYYAQAAGRPFDQLSDEEINRLRPLVQRQIATARRDTVFVKTHNAFTLCDGVPTILPEASAGVVYVIRNPLDLCVSYAHHYGIPIDTAIEALASPFNRIVTERATAFQVLGGWSDHVKSWLEPPPMPHHTMRYEDMLAQPAKAFGRLVTFLKLPKNKARLDKAIRFSSFKVLSGQERQDGFVERSAQADRFFREGRAGGWRSVLTPDQAGRIVEQHRETMDRFGYLAPDGSPRY